MRYKYLLLYVLFLPISCFGHPHSFITLKTDFITEQDNLTSIKFVWEMDEMTSSYLKYESKRDPKKVFNQFMINVFENHFFSEFRLKTKSTNQLIKLMPLEKGARLDLTSPKAVAYFEAKLKQPIAVAGQEFELMTYEKTFYVDMYYETDKQVKINNSNCSIRISKPTPDDSVMDYAQSLDKTDTPIESEDFLLGKFFAQKVVIKCK